MNSVDHQTHSHPAMFGVALEGGKVRCDLCHHRCVVPEGKVGACWVRENRVGELVTLVYNLAVATHVDPIEKKPLFHMRPGTDILSIATVGCNFRCAFCQNWQISQKSKGRERGEITGAELSARDLVAIAKQKNCQNMAYTYSEPTIFFEYAHDVCKEATKNGIHNVFVSNGYMTTEALECIKPHLQAINVDLKGFDDKRYRQVMGGKLNHVLETLMDIKRLGIWLEVTTLVIPGVNDSLEELKTIAAFIHDELGPETPWHVSRFHPDYKMLDTEHTPPETLLRAWRAGKEAGLHYVYMGNLDSNLYPEAKGCEDTNCHNCGFTLIERRRFTVLANRLKNGTCPKCQTALHGIDL